MVSRSRQGDGMAGSAGCPPSVRPRWIGAALALIATLGSPAGGRAAEAAVVVAELPGPGDLAVTPNGQTVLCLDDSTGAIVALDPREPDRKRTVLAAAPAGQPWPVAIGCLDTTTIVALCRDGGRFCLRTWRLVPDRAAEPAAPLQELPVADVPSDDEPLRLAVSPTRDWLVIAGAQLPGGLSRCPIAGVRLGRPSDRGCPRVPPGERPVAVAINAADQFVVVERRPGGAAPDRLAMSEGIAGRRVLALDIHLQGIRDLAISPETGTLWAATSSGDDAERPAGVWRLDATVRHGRQAVEPVCVVPLAGITGIACPTAGMVVVSQGAPRGRILRIDLSAAATPSGDPNP